MENKLECSNIDEVNSKNKNQHRKNESFVKNSIIHTFYQLLTIITPLITTPYVSRVLGVEGIGIYSYTHSLVSYFMLFSSLGTIAYGTREIARRRLDQNDFSKTFWEIETLTIFTSLSCLMVWGVFALTYSRYRIYLLICSFYIVSVMLDISWLYAGLEKFKYTVCVNSIFRIIGVMMIFIFVKSSNDVTAYVFINALVIFGGNLSMWIFLPRVLSKTRISFVNIKKHFKETLVYFIPSIAVSIYTVLDKTLIGVICQDDKLNGCYEQGTKILNIAKTISFTGIVGVVSPRMSFLYKINDLEKIKKISLNTLNIVIYLSFAVVVGILSISDIFVPMFFGDGYDEVIKVLYFMMPLCLIICFSNIIGGLYYTPVGKRKQSSLYLIIGAITNLSLNLILIPIWNVYGAIVASIIAELLITFLYLFNSKGFYSIRDILEAIWKKIIAALIMTIVIVLLKNLDYSFFSKKIYNLLVENLIIICIGALTYVGVTIILRDKTIKLAYKFLRRKRDKL